MAEPLLKVSGLRTHFFTEEGTVKAVDGVDFELPRGGHLLLLRGFLHSYAVIPLDGMPPVGGFTDLVVRLLGGFFLAALQIAAPLVAASFLADIALGLLTRTAPSLNVFSLGFPIKIGLTLLMVGLTLPLLPGAVDGLVGDAVGGMLELTGG